MQYSVQGLKSVLEFILEHLGTLDESVADHLDRLIKNKSVTDGHIDELEALRKGLKETKDKNDAQDVYIDKHGDQLKN